MKKYLIYILGMNVLALGIILNARSGLGVAAFSTLPYSISHIFNITFGQANIMIYLLIVFIQILIEKKLTLSILLEIPFSFGFGFITDLYDFVIPEMSGILIVSCVILIIGNTCSAFGVYCMVSSDLIVTPVDGIVASVSKVSNQPYSLCKNIFDISMIIITLLVTLIARSPIYGMGIGTIFSAFYIGRIMKVFEQKLPLHIKNS